MIESELHTLCRTQTDWATKAIASRLDVVRAFRHLLAEQAPTLAKTACAGLQRDEAELVITEILPLAEACKFLEKNATQILKPRRPSLYTRPGWLMGVNTKILREPFGIIAILAPFNYPVFLPFVQAVHALVAGNAVVVKPAHGGHAIAEALARLLVEAGLPDGLIHVTDESIEAGQALVDANIDKLVLTGSAETGAKVLGALASRAIPAIVELAGNDAMIALPGADPAIVADAVAYGLRLNSSQTCIAPRRLVIVGQSSEPLVNAILERVASLPAATIPNVVCERLCALTTDLSFAAGTIDPQRFTPVVLTGVSEDADILKADIFAPVICMLSANDAVDAARLVNASPFGLGTSIFGNAGDAEQLATRLNTGFVTINDIIVPTADPRAPFGGTKSSGFGVTRGAEGLLEMTRPKTIFTRKGTFLPHLNPPLESDMHAYSHLLLALHGKGFTQRAKAFKTALKGLIAQTKSGR
ncbi:MAG: aldehyde dehydrogenase family protein [Hyphomicrobiales bacterium]